MVMMVIDGMDATILRVSSWAVTHHYMSWNSSLVHDAHIVATLDPLEQLDPLDSLDSLDPLDTLDPLDPLDPLEPLEPVDPSSWSKYTSPTTTPLQT